MERARRTVRIEHYSNILRSHLILTKSAKHQKNTTTSKNKLKKSTALDKEVIKEKREKERVDTVIDSILEAGGSDALKFFIRFIGKNIKENGNE